MSKNAREPIILEDICPGECIVGAQGNHQHKMKENSLEADVMNN